jgi:branched-chain amino acid transport system permease protein
LTGSALISQVLLNGFMDASIYILVALGLTLTLSIAGILNLAHGEIYMLGAYLTYYFSVRLGLHFILALTLGILLMGVLGILIERVFFRPFYKNESFWSSVMMATGLMLTLQTFGKVAFGSTSRIISTPFKGTFVIAGASISFERLIIIGISLLFVAGIFIMLQRTRIGQSMIAISQNRKGAALQGISVKRVSTFTLFVGCALAALAGGLMGAIFSLSPSMGSPALLKGIAVIILGGLGSIPGVVAGGLILGFVDSIVPLVASVEAGTMVGFLIIILILIFRPQGIMGRPF